MLHYFPYISLTILIKHRKYSIYSKKMMIILLSLKNDAIHGNASIDYRNYFNLDGYESIRVSYILLCVY